ncbi:glycosyltransferase [Flagellimonas lutimaris]|uniref:Glycosyltransferase n=1 Tax=Flagellimonas lutimaris TaxID=475082 RepID=A0A3A1NBF4_9FLAO|nr:WecB/TagA/CpsF family glycosyltransferase [Allomuricauda lutimaris]RIV34996.1 glycosyltransferase [Allomuricauda lutimaris]
MDKKNLLGYDVLVTSLNTVKFDNKCVVNTINIHSYAVAKKDKLFKNALLSGEILIPDGIGIVYASKILSGKKIKKIAGYDAFIFLMEKLEKEKGSCFFLGSSENTLQRIVDRSKKDYPNVTVNTYSPPFKKVFDESDNGAMVNAVNKVNPDVLFVGMTAPKQEKWVFVHKENLEADIICSIGAVFDFYAGTIERPSKIWIDLGLEWFIRFLQNPRKMFPRVFVSTPIFMKDLLLEKLRAN